MDILAGIMTLIALGSFLWGCSYQAKCSDQANKIKNLRARVASQEALVGRLEGK